MSTRPRLSYVGTPMWVRDSQEAQGSWVVIHEDQWPVVGYRYPARRFVEAEADTGSRYVVVATPLGAAGRRSLGGPVLVTVCSPWNDCWALQDDDRVLSSFYVAEHLTGDRWQTDRLNAGDLAALTMTVAHALGRPFILNAGFPRPEEKKENT